MAKKKYVAGSADRRRRGLRTLVVPVRPEVHAALSLAAALYPRRPVSQYSAAALEAAARQALADAGVPWPVVPTEEIPAKPAHST